MTQNRKYGFTLIELLVVILIIGILVGLLLPTLVGIKKRSKARRAKAEMKALETAIVHYRFENREWPGPHPENGDAIYGDGIGTRNSLVIQRMIATTPPYLDIDDFTDQNGSVVDPWGSEYRIKLDTDYDGKLEHPQHPGDPDRSLHWGVMLWSDNLPNEYVGS